MAETKDEIAAERDQLRQRVAQLEAQQATAGRVVAPRQTFQLSEGDRQDLVANGVLNVAGRLRTRDEVADMLGDGQTGVELGDRPPSPTLLAAVGQQRAQGATPGVDFVYPSVEPGGIDPVVAGTPGISGPAAGDGPAEDFSDLEID